MERAVTDLFQEPEDATPLEPEEREGLLQSWITHRSDLNEAEQENILAGAAWARGGRGRKPAALLNVGFALALHKRMFGEVWRWAGTFRRTARNIGIDAYRIQMEMAALFNNVRYWRRCPRFLPEIRRPDDVAADPHAAVKARDHHALGRGGDPQAVEPSAFDPLRRREGGDDPAVDHGADSRADDAADRRAREAEDRAAEGAADRGADGAENKCRHER